MRQGVGGHTHEEQRQFMSVDDKAADLIDLPLK